MLLNKMMCFNICHTAAIIVVVCLSFSSASLNYGSCDAQYSGHVEFADAIGNAESSTLIECSAICAENIHCLTFFHHAESLQCVMHSRLFNYKPPSIVEAGWQLYIVRGVGKRCPYPYLYYKHLDFCYLIVETDSINFQGIKENCTALGGKLAAIENQQKYDYFRYILTGRPHTRVPLAGTRINENEWRLEDNSVLTFFKWASTEPTNQECLELYDSDLHYDCTCVFNQPKPGVFLCEMKAITKITTNTQLKKSSKG